jgi:pimeloyl-ACP methyl ester carboxylesterase
VRSFDGVDIAVHNFPAVGDGPDIWLSHATGFCAGCWRPVAEGLRTAAGRIVGWDHRGHGSSAGGSFPVSWWDMASDGSSVVSMFPERRAISIGVGHSMGGATLAMLELTRPGTFDAIVAVEPILLAPPSRRTAYPLADVVRRRRRSFPTREKAHANFSRKAPFSRWHPDALAGYMSDGLRDTTDGVELACLPEFEAEVYDTAGGHGVFALIGALAIPFVVIVGDSSDTYDLAWGAELCDAMPKGRLCAVPGGSHFIPMESPEIVVAEVLAVADRLAQKAE